MSCMKAGPSLSMTNKQALADYMANRYERSQETPRYCVCRDHPQRRIRRYSGQWLCRCGRLEAA